MDWSNPIPPIPAPPDEARLVAALWTSYRPISPEFLACDVLPQLMEIDRRENEEAESREFFIAEVMQALEPLRERRSLTVITSLPISRADSQDNTWLWHYITPFTVGKNGPYIQHAKLWLHHWESNKGEHLQITVSSTNLTPDAFKHQIQAEWTITLPIEKNMRKPQKNNLDTLVNFLSELGMSANCSDRIAYWNSLVARTKPPEDVIFIASIPGKASPLNQWPIQKTNKLWILTPYIGQWDSHSLGLWKTAICKKRAAINLLWPDKDHGWVIGCTDNDGQTNWKIPRKSVDALLEQGGCLRQLPEPPVFIENDNRWGHLKLYNMDDGLLIGSHNWSVSAWGLPTDKEKDSPTNFELSVFIPHTRIPCNLHLRKLSKEEVNIREEDILKPEGIWLSWAQAQWDGTLLKIEWKITEPVTIAWYDGKEWHPVKVANINNASVPISNIDQAPRLVKFIPVKSEDDEISIPVADIRPGDNLLPVGLSPSMKEKADLILLEKYGGPQAEIIINPGPPRTRKKKSKKKSDESKDPADYRPKWLISSRRWSKVVDKWRERFEGKEDRLGISHARRLSDALERLSTDEKHGGIGALIAAEELRLLSGVKK